MKIETKFNLGDTIHVVSSVAETEQCPACTDGTVLLGGLNYTCPVCEGGQVVVTGMHRWEWAGSGRVTTVRTVSSDAESKVVYVTNHMSSFIPLTSEEQNCFASKEEAVEECRQRNKETPAAERNAKAAKSA